MVTNALERSELAGPATELPREMRARQPVDLSKQQRIGSVIYSSASPSLSETTVRWPDGRLEKVKLDVPGRPGKVVLVHGGLTLCLFLRGSPEHTPYLEKMANAQAEMARKKAELEEQAAQTLQDDLLETAQEIGVPTPATGRPSYEAGPSSDIGAPPGPPTTTCPYPGAHFDCPLCPDATTGHPPKHHGKAVPLSGHMNSAMHRKREAAHGAGVST